MSFKVVKVSCSDDFADIFMAEMSEVGFDSFSDLQGGFEASIESATFDKELLKEIFNRYEQMTAVSYLVEEVEKKNWNEEWEKNYDPIFIEDQCVVRASFHQIDKDFPYEIIINPKMSFGTGHHETTHLMLAHQLGVDHEDKASLVISYCLVAIGIFLALAAAGIGLDRISIFVGAFGVGIGFGLQNIANNLISGIILAAERPIQVEDIIEVKEQVGVVKKIGFRSSIIRTYDGADIIVPNGDLISQEVTNWTHTDKRRRIEILVGVAYGTDLQMVKELLEKTISEHKLVVRQPNPLVFFTGFGNSSLDFRMLVWTHHIDQWIGIKSDICMAIDLAFKENGIEIPFPQRDLHLRSGLDKVAQPKKNRKQDSYKKTWQK